MTISEKRVLVTGANSGIGFAIARTFLDQGARTAVHARTPEKANETIERLDGIAGHAIPVFADLTDPSSIEELCGNTIDKLGGIDIVVNNAGVLKSGSVVDMSEADWDLVMTTNLRAPFLIAKHTLPQMYANKSGGRQILISSVGAKISNPTLAAYNASKAGVLGLMRCLAAEAGPFGVTSNAVCPGWVDTPMAEDYLRKTAIATNTDYGKVLDEQLDKNLLDGIVNPDDVARAVLFLASDDAGHITGQAINVCAGSCVW